MLSASEISQRAHSVRLERRIDALRRNRRTFLHATWLLLALTWGVGWPLCQWRTAHHEAVGRIEPAVLRLAALAPDQPPPEFMLLDAFPRLRHGVEVTQASSGGGKVQQFYVPMTASGRDSEEVRVVAAGLSPYLLDPRSPAPLRPPYALRWVRDEALPAGVRREMTRRGARLAESLYLLRPVELVQGRVLNRDAFADHVIEQVVTISGTTLSLMAALAALLTAWRLRGVKRERAQLPAHPVHAMG